MNSHDLEANRVEAEQFRQQGESARQSAELERTAAELARHAAEQARVEAEAVRRGAVSELGDTVAALTSLIDRMEHVEAMRRAAGRDIEEPGRSS